ncbi:hypothetical protein FSC37_09880 [Piscinibacter aquaticus]|uniref:Uncharacterized protein n=1 Tax=Piscinibacter aquaticus TaxID=392597 RepID=A0A5C6U355_9BURK|nr:hypothetical protein FSC37_09880 [Piscinibacter aquaticus]
MRRQGAPILAVGWIAENLSIEISLQIKHLHEHDNAVTALLARQGAWPLAVEFLHRAGAGFERG